MEMIIHRDSQFLVFGIVSLRFNARRIQFSVNNCDKYDFQSQQKQLYIIVVVITINNLKSNNDEAKCGTIMRINLQISYVWEYIKEKF